MTNGAKVLSAIFVLLCLVCCGGGYFLLSVMVDDKNAMARRAGDEYLKKITDHWDPKELVADSSDEYKGQLDKDEIDHSFAGYRKTLGNFLHGKGTTRLQKVEHSKSGSSVAANYEADAQFSKGKALIKMSLTMEHGHWWINFFRVDPPR